MSRRGTIEAKTQSQLITKEEFTKRLEIITVLQQYDLTTLNQLLSLAKDLESGNFYNQLQPMEEFIDDEREYTKNESVPPKKSDQLQKEDEGSKNEKIITYCKICNWEPSSCKCTPIIPKVSEPDTENLFFYKNKKKPLLVTYAKVTNAKVTKQETVTTSEEVTQTRGIEEIITTSSLSSSSSSITSSESPPSSSPSSPIKKCERCNNIGHTIDKCIVKTEKKCTNCGKFGHWHTICGIRCILCNRYGHIDINCNFK